MNYKRPKTSVKQSKGKSIKATPEMDRPREKMLSKGPKALSNMELVAALLGSGVRGRDLFQVAEDIVELCRQDFDSLSMETLKKIQGIGNASACRIMAAIEFSKRFLLKEGISIQSDKDVLNMVRELGDKKQEYFITLTVDGNNMLIKKRIVFIGTLNQSLVHPREVYADAITDHAAGIILVHNHPSGNCEASRDDYKATDRLVEAGKIVGITVLDHLIVSKNDYFSFRKSGYLEKDF
ncbi:MAG: JAB domain-containing protein [bacterium]|nr:JAB domain-containing protein [bacterium]